jgi:four helix bundle protein
MAQDLKTRTKKFAIDCWRLCKYFPNSREYNAYVNQLIRCSSSVGANYRATQRAKSTADFMNKLKIVEEETDESHFFLELLYEIYDLKEEAVKIEIIRLIKEANELTAIVVSSINTAKSRLK